MNINIKKEADNKYEIIIDVENGIKTIYTISYRDLYQLHNKILDIVNQQENKYNK